MADYDEILIALRKITRAIDLHSKQLHKASGLTTSQLLVMQAILRLDMALGEGSGAALATSIVKAAFKCHVEMATFEDAGVSGKQ